MCLCFGLPWEVSSYICIELDSTKDTIPCQFNNPHLNGGRGHPSFILSIAPACSKELFSKCRLRKLSFRLSNLEEGKGFSGKGLCWSTSVLESTHLILSSFHPASLPHTLLPLTPCPVLTRADLVSTDSAMALMGQHRPLHWCHYS